MARGALTIARCRLRVVDDALTDSVLEQFDALLRDALVVERDRQPSRVRPIVPDGDEVAADLLARLHERALLLNGQGTEAQVAQHVQDVHDGVLLEDDGVVAGLERLRIAGRAGLFGRLPSDSNRVDGTRANPCLLRVPTPAVGRHGHGDQLG